MTQCKTIGCNEQAQPADDFCGYCNNLHHAYDRTKANAEVESMAKKYPAYFKDVSHLTEIDVYAVHHVFDLQDPSGILHHASKKILLSGVRTGGKSVLKDIKEARDSLTRYLQLNAEETPA